MGTTKSNIEGFRCPVRGCRSKKSKLFTSSISVALHIKAIHGEDELAKRLRIKERVNVGCSTR